MREINSHVFTGTGYCVVYTNEWQSRITWARTRKGVKEGRVLNINRYSETSNPELKEDRMGISWVAIPADARVELS